MGRKPKARKTRRKSSKRRSRSKSNARLSSRESDAGDVAKKFIDALIAAYQAGGAGLVLMSLGGVVIFFLVLIQDAFQSQSKYWALMAVGIFFALIGAYVLIKEKSR